MNFRVIAAIILIVAAIGLGLLADRLFHQNLPKKHVASIANATEIIVAGRALPGGTLARTSDFRIARVPGNHVPTGAIVYSKSAVASLNGALIRHYIEAGHFVPRDDILRPHDRGFLAAVLAPGMRAISIPVNNVSGVAGLIWPGDHVDVLLTESVSNGYTPIADRTFSEVVLHDVRVLAIGRSIVQGASGNPKASAASSKVIYNTVTLQVTSTEAQELVVAERLGGLSLIVVSATSRPVVANASTTTTARSSAISSDSRPAALVVAEPRVTMGSPTMPPASGTSNDGTVYASSVSPALAKTTRPVDQRINLIQGTSRMEIQLP